MANSYSQIFIHVTFHVKEGNYIDINDLKELFNYITGIVTSEKGFLLSAGGVKDHIHLLLTLPKTLSLSEYILKIKANSSRWLKTKGSLYRNFAWQDGYGAFSVSPTVINKVKLYIDNQEEHHRHKSYHEELVDFLNAYGVEYDKRYL